MKQEENYTLSSQEIREKLDGLEEKYNMTSEEYYHKYNKGKADELGIEGADALRWATLWETWIKDN